MVNLYKVENITMAKITTFCNKYLKGGNYSIGKDYQNDFCVLGVLIQKPNQPELQMLDDLFKALHAQGVKTAVF